MPNSRCIGTGAREGDIGLTPGPCNGMRSASLRGEQSERLNGLDCETHRCNGMQGLLQEEVRREGRRERMATLLFRCAMQAGSVSECGEEKGRAVAAAPLCEQLHPYETVTGIKALNETMTEKELNACVRS